MQDQRLEQGPAGAGRAVLQAAARAHRALRRQGAAGRDRRRRRAAARGRLHRRRRPRHRLQLRPPELPRHARGHPRHRRAAGEDDRRRLGLLVVRQPRRPPRRHPLGRRRPARGACARCCRSCSAPCAARSASTRARSWGSRRPSSPSSSSGTRSASPSGRPSRAATAAARRCPGHGRAARRASRTGEPWLPVPASHRRRAVDVQDADPHSVLNTTRAFLHWRRERQPLQTGRHRVRRAASGDVLAFERGRRRPAALPVQPRRRAGSATARRRAAARCRLRQRGRRRSRAASVELPPWRLRLRRISIGERRRWPRSSMRRRHASRSAPVHIIKGVDLDIEPNEFVVFVGPSGCGKSTLLRLIAGLEDITSGELLIGGEVVNDLPPAERGISMVFQSYALYPHMTVYDNMALRPEAGEDRRRRGRPERVAERRPHPAARPLLERKPKQLSGGQRQRVAIGRAIVRDPRCSCSTSRCPTSTPPCASRCGSRSPSCTTSSTPP